MYGWLINNTRSSLTITHIKLASGNIENVNWIMLISPQDYICTDGAVSRGHASEPKGREFETHSCHLVRTYGR